jgi:hypothetical protein
MSGVQAVRVTKDTIKTSATLNAIADAAANKIKAQQTVNLGSGASISIDKQVMLEAFREALGLSATRTSGSPENTLARLVSIFTDGSAKVKVANSSVEPVYVDTQRYSTLYEVLDNN